jgi:hypothetical protein
VLPSIWENLTLQSSKDGQIIEFAKKYCGSFMLYDDPDYEGVVVKIKNDETGEANFCVYNPAFGHIPLSYSGTDQVVTPIFPDPGAFTFSGRYFVGNRIPERQYLKSVSEQSYFPIEVMKSLILPSHVNGFQSIGNSGDTFRILSASIYPEYIGFEFRTSMPETHVGYAINNEWGITRHPLDNKKFLLWHLNNAVAEVVENEIRMVNHLMTQEVKDFVRDYNINGVVV